MNKKNTQFAPPARALSEPAWVPIVVISATVCFLGLFLILPIIVVFIEAFSKGVSGYAEALATPGTWEALRLTLIVVAVVVPINTVFGLAAGWVLSRYEFTGKETLIALIDLPFSISPVVSGLMYVLVFGLQGRFGAWLAEHDIQIIFAAPGIILATLFVTLPYVAREIVPLMQSRGADEEEAAATLGARGWLIFTKVTLPNIKWALLYGVIHCTARALGEFGAVSVVSGHIRGETNTVPLHIEILYNEYNFTASFALASTFVLFGLASLAIKQFLERRHSP